METIKFVIKKYYVFYLNQIIYLILIVCFLKLAGCSDSQDNNYSMNHLYSSSGTTSWVLHSLDDISSYQSVPTSDKATLVLIKGEYEHFQLVLRSETDDVFAVERLDKTDGVEFNCRAITGFEGHEDVLVPCNGSVKVSGNLAKLWITYHATSQATAGRYQETLVFSGATQKIYIEVILEVHAIILPETSSITTVFGIYTTHLMPQNSSSSEFENKYREMTDLLLSYRISPFSNIWPAVSSPYTWNDPRTMTYISDNRFSRIALPCYSLSEEELQSMLGSVMQNGLLDKSYIYVLDEPSSLDAYAQVKMYSDRIKKISPDLKTMVTFYKGPDGQGEGMDGFMKAFDYLRGSVRIFCTGYYALQNDEQNSKRCRENILPGEEWWTYACMSDKPGLSYNSSPIENRIVLWRCWKEQNTGFLYWSVNGFASTEPLASSTNLPAGDGVLVYPGRPFGSEVPLVSVRLERWRDGAEDYELLTMLENKKGRVFTQALLQRVYQNPLKYTNDPEEVEMFKTRLIREIES